LHHKSPPRPIPGADSFGTEADPFLESLHAFKRAGAAGVLSYFAPRAAMLLGG